MMWPDVDWWECLFFIVMDYSQFGRWGLINRCESMPSTSYSLSNNTEEKEEADEPGEEGEEKKKKKKKKKKKEEEEEEEEWRLEEGSNLIFVIRDIPRQSREKLQLTHFGPLQILTRCFLHIWNNFSSKIKGWREKNINKNCEGKIYIYIYININKISLSLFTHTHNVLRNVETEVPRSFPSMELWRHRCCFWRPFNPDWCIISFFFRTGARPEDSEDFKDSRRFSRCGSEEEGGREEEEKGTSFRCCGSWDKTKRKRWGLRRILLRLARNNSSSITSGFLWTLHCDLKMPCDLFLFKDWGWDGIKSKGPHSRLISMEWTSDE